MSSRFKPQVFPKITSIPVLYGKRKQLVEKMLADYECFVPSANPFEHKMRMDLMCINYAGFINRDAGKGDNYVDGMSKHCADRLYAYTHNDEANFMSQVAEIITCTACGASCYHIDMLINEPLCAKCVDGETKVTDITVAQIPPWTDIDEYWGEH